MSWSPEGDLQFEVFKKKGQQLKYVVQESNHTPGTLRAIPSWVLNRLAKLTSRNPSIHAEVSDKIYPDHANALRKVGLAPPDFSINIPLLGKQEVLGPPCGERSHGRDKSYLTLQRGWRDFLR